MKYIHIIINSSYTAPFIDIINRNFEQGNHVFYVIRGLSEEKIKIPKYKNVYVISNSKNILNVVRFLKDMNFSKKIFFHGLFSPFLVSSLFFQPWLLKKANWIIWGGDLHLYSHKRNTIKSKFEEFMRKIVIKNISEISGCVRDDYNLAKKWYNVKAVYRRVMYSTQISTPEIDAIIENRNSVENELVANIQIGNSATESNNHFEIIDSLKQFADENIKVYALLAYGEPVYTQKVISYGKSVFKDKFIAITDYMKSEDFILFMNRMDIVIFNHFRQQAMGNVWLAIYLKKKVFLREGGALWEFFENDYKFEINKTQSIKEIDFITFREKNKIDLEYNKVNAKIALDEKHFVDLWNVLFDK